MAIEGCFRSLVYRKGGGEVLVVHDNVSGVSSADSVDQAHASILKLLNLT